MSIAPSARCSAIALCASALLVTAFPFAAPAQSVSEGNRPAIEEIVVKGQKREQALKEVNSSVAVYSGDLIDSLTFQELTDLYRFTPNVIAAESDEGEFNIRGIFYRGENFSESGNTASVYIDGVFQSNLAVEAGPQSIFDLAAVEIYRGPQSTIQGRNALAGAIIVRTQDPTFEWDARARVQTAEYGTRRIGVAVGGPILEDELAFRVAYEDARTDGFIENPVLGIDDYNADDTENLRVKLLWEPEALDTFSALLSYAASTGLAGPGFGTGGIDGPNFLERKSFAANNTLLDIETDNWALTLRNRFSDQITLEWISTWSEANELGGPRFEFDPAAGLDVTTDDEEILTTELRTILDGDRWSGVAGLYYFNRERTRTRDLFFPVPGTDIFVFQDVAQESENYAVYFDGEFQMTPAWALLFGARYDEETYDDVGASAIAFVPSGSANPIDPGSLATNVTDTDFGAFLPKLGIRWDMSERLSWSLVIQRGYRAGGAAIDGDNNAYTYDPEYTTNYELALRSSWFDDRLIVNGNVFFMDWTDQQVFVTNPDNEFEGLIQNAGESSVSGVEIDFTAALSARLSMFGALGYLDTEFEQYEDFFSGNLTGNEFGRAPDFQWALGFNYEHENGFYGSVDAGHSSEAYSSSLNLPENQLDSYTVMNAKLGYRWRQWDFAVFGRNVLDEEYFIRIDRNDSRAPAGFGFAQVGAPRVIGVEARASF